MVNLYTKYFKYNLKKQIEYKMSFILNSISQLFVFFSYYFVILAIFEKFNNIKGYTLYEILLCFSIIQFGFSFNETFFRGIDRFEDFIIKGDLDRLLLRPRNILLQVLCSEIDFVKIFRVLQSIIILIISLKNIEIVWSINKIITLILMLLASILIFFGLFVLMSSYCFITVQGLEVKNLVTDGGKFLAQYPLSIYKKGVIFFFTYIIPYAFINYYPLMYFLDKNTNILYMLSPILVFIFIIPCLLLFKIGLKHYSSTGS